jgi:hypothetical protein
MHTLFFILQFLAGIAILALSLLVLDWSAKNETNFPLYVVLFVWIIFWKCLYTVADVIFKFFGIFSFLFDPAKTGSAFYAFGSVLFFILQLCLALLPIGFTAFWIKKRFFPAFSFRALFEVNNPSQGLTNSLTTPNNLEQVGSEEIPSNNSMPIFLRKRAQRLGLTPDPSSNPNASNSQAAQSAESSQPVPAEPIDPTLLPPSEDVPGQTVYRRIIPIQP